MTMTLKQWRKEPLQQRRSRRGCTLIEMLIVIVVIAILALIVIQRFGGIGRRSREAALRSDLHHLRTAIEHFEADTGAFPPDLIDILAADGASISADADGAGRSVYRVAYQGPYLRTGDNALPNDPMTSAADWTYDNASGDVHSSSTLTALDGTDYTTW